jgi:hypothetical protein
LYLFYQVPDNDYKVVVITYDGDEKYCDGSADVQSTTCLVPTGLASDNVMHTSFTMLWDEMAGALYYEVWINGVFYKAIAGPFFDFVEGEPETSYLVKIRSNCGTLLFSDFCAEVEVITAIAP